MTIKALGFDFFGTLVDAQADWRECVLLTCKYLQRYGYDFSDDDFMSNYREVVSEHRKTRYETFREVNNCVWVADTLNRLGIEVESSCPDIKSAVDEYFNLWELTLAPDAPTVLRSLNKKYTVSLVSNFTHSFFLHQSLRKLGIEKFFDHIIDSDTVGWRKPHPNIFNHFLKTSRVKAVDAVFIGDNPETDIKGAKGIGIKAVLLVKPGQVQAQLSQVLITPDHIVSSLSEFRSLLESGEI